MKAVQEKPNSLNIPYHINTSKREADPIGKPDLNPSLQS